MTTDPQTTNPNQNAHQLFSWLWRDYLRPHRRVLALAVVFMAIVLYGIVPELYLAWRDNYFVGEEGLFTVPEWPIKFILVLGCAVTMLQFLKFAIRHVVPVARGVR